MVTTATWCWRFWLRASSAESESLIAFDSSAAIQRDQRDASADRVERFGVNFDGSPAPTPAS
jgi:hypothetical protein